MTTEYGESMARVQPVLSATELALVDQMAEFTHSKRTDVIKSALAVYHWFVRQALTGGRVISRKPTGEEVSFETAELSALEGKGNRLSPEELGLLAKELAAAPNPIEAGRSGRGWHPQCCGPERLCGNHRRIERRPI